MKIGSLLKLAVAAFLISGLLATNALADDATGTGTASVVSPIAINWVSNLNWGTFAPDPVNPGTVTVGTFGVPTSTNVTYLVLGDPGIFNVTGDPNRPFSVGLSANPHTFTGGNPANTMTGNLIYSHTSSLNAVGIGGVQVGGTLDVGASQPADVYTGNYTVTVSYN